MFDPEAIKSDGKLNGSGPDVLFSRVENVAEKPEDRLDSDMPTVTLVFDYEAFNAAFAGQPGFTPFDPLNLRYLEFEATRGLKDNQNYLWNDKYNLDEAGTPYDVNNPTQNIYELDTLRSGGFLIPTPVAVWPALTALAMLATQRRRRKS